MKTIRRILVLAGFGLLASTANATLIDLGETGDAGNPGAEAVLACDAFGGDFCSLIYDHKFEGFTDAGGFPAGPESGVSGGTYSLANYVISTTPATVDLTWNLDATGFGLWAIAVKAGKGIHWYGLDDDMRVMGTDMTIASIAGKDSISHITLFVRAFDGGPGECPPSQIGTPPNCEDPPVGVPEPGTLGLLGLGLLGLGLRRRSKV